MDKFLHILVSAIIVVMVGTIAHLAMRNVAPLALGIGLLCGIAKEIYDNHKVNNKWDWWDILADFFGCVIGLIIVLIWQS